MTLVKSPLEQESRRAPNTEGQELCQPAAKTVRMPKFVHIPLKGTMVYRQQGRTSQRTPTPNDWERIRPIFTQLYFIENKELRIVKQILKDEHNFIATHDSHIQRNGHWLISLQRQDVQDKNQGLEHTQKL
jgi:Clr5 domain